MKHNLTAAAKRAAAVAADLLPDAALVAGAGLVSYGAAMIYEPAGYIIGGAFLLFAGWAAARNAAKAGAA